MHTDRQKFRLIEQFNYYGKLSAQFPIPRLRVVYAKAGTLPAACFSEIERDNRPHAVLGRLRVAKLKGITLCIFNSETSRARVATMQSRGQWGARHFDKVMFTLPIPRFDSAITLHNELAAAAAEAERIAAAFELPASVKFQRARKLIRDALTESGIAPHIDELVARLLDQPEANEDEGVDD